jgi:hypothetical protein
MPLDTSIARSIPQVQFAPPPDPLANYTQFAALQHAQNQNALAQQQLAEYGRARAEEESVRNYFARQQAAGVPLTSPAFVQGLYGISPTRATAFQKSLVDTEKEQLAAAELRAKGAIERQKFLASARRDISQRPSDANITAHMEDMLASDLFSAEEKTRIKRETEQFLQLPYDRRVAALSGQGASAAELKPHITVVDQSGQRTLAATPAFGGTPTTLATYADVPLPPGVEAQKGRLAQAGAPRVNVSTEKGYGQTFASNVAKADTDKMAAAERAPALAESANRIIGLVQQGNLFVGPVADIKLNISRALNVAGADNDEKIANTEALIAATGQSTLDAIKGAGLGTGQGFTDKDLKFLQGVAGGTINLTEPTLTHLATLQHRVATKAADAWNSRVMQIPKEVLQGTGISTTPITVPPLMRKGGAAAPAAAGAVDTSNPLLKP